MRISKQINNEQECHLLTQLQNLRTVSSLFYRLSKREELCEGRKGKTKTIKAFRKHPRLPSHTNLGMESPEEEQQCLRGDLAMLSQHTDLSGLKFSAMFAAVLLIRPLSHCWLCSLRTRSESLQNRHSSPGWSPASVGAEGLRAGPGRR